MVNSRPVRNPASRKDENMLLLRRRDEEEGKKRKFGGIERGRCGRGKWRRRRGRDGWGAVSKLLGETARWAGVHGLPRQMDRQADRWSDRWMDEPVVCPSMGVLADTFRQVPVLKDWHMR